jgi:hypothetical protein
VTQAEGLPDSHPDIQQHSEQQAVLQVLAGVEDRLNLFDSQDLRSRR